MRLITDQTISSTSTLGPYQVAAGAYTTIWDWMFEMPSGSGTNTLTVTLVRLANPEDDGSSQQTFSADQARLWNGPYIITDAMITAASGTKYKCSYVVKGSIGWIKPTFTYAGGGSRAFKVNVWVNW